MGLGSDHDGFSVEGLVQFVIGLAFRELSQIVDADLPREVLSSAALALLPNGLEYDLETRALEVEAKIGHEIDRIQRDLDRLPGGLGGELERLMVPPPGKD